MAKATKSASKATARKAESKKSESPFEAIVKACETSLKKLNDLDIEHALQSEINWCLGSFKNDQNPVGLFQMAERSLGIFKNELSKKTKGITSKLIGDIEKALKSR